jgi:EAL domain-containing protein (putative c-di-GMP-specific phosphodiesterase class I)
MEIAHNLGCKVVAEGVEKKEQFEALRNIHCDMFQGYYFGKPVDEDTFEKYFLKHSA